MNLLHYLHYKSTPQQNPVSLPLVLLCLLNKMEDLVLFLINREITELNYYDINVRKHLHKTPS